jgi:hypothetical protein
MDVVRMVVAFGLAGGALVAACSSSSSSGGGSGQNAADAAADSSTPQNEAGTSDAGVITIACGSGTCPTTTSICCVYPPPSGTGDFTYQCVVGDVCPGVDAGAAGPDAGDIEPTALGCTGTSTCTNGNVCCIRPNDLSVGPQSHISECRGSCDSDDGQLCDPNAATSGCAATAMCSSSNIRTWGLPSTFATCGGVNAPAM